MHCVSTITHITRYSRRRAVGLFAPMILAPFRRLRLEVEESPTGNGTPFRQNHFRCNPSRMLVGRHSRFAANNALPRLMVLPRRDFPTHHPHSRGCSASRHHTCYASCGVTKRKDSSRPVQLHCHCPLQTCSEGTPVSVTPTPCGVERRHRHSLAARESASKMQETCSPRKGGIRKMCCLSRPGAIRYITTKTKHYSIGCRACGTRTLHEPRIPRNSCDSRLPT